MKGVIVDKNNSFTYMYKKATMKAEGKHTPYSFLNARFQAQYYYKIKTVPPFGGTVLMVRITGPEVYGSTVNNSS